MSCKVAADCVYAQSPAFDVDNYACKNGLCTYSGCNTDAECQQTMGGKDYACATQSGVKSCQHTCAKAVDSMSVQRACQTRKTHSR